jgi:hypothetical protein
MANSYYSLNLSGFITDVTGGTTAKGIWTKNAMRKRCKSTADAAKLRQNLRKSGAESDPVYNLLQSTLVAANRPRMEPRFVCIKVIVRVDAFCIMRDAPPALED